MALFVILLCANDFVLPNWINDVFNFLSLANGFVIMTVAQLTSTCRNEFGQIDPDKKKEYLDNKFKV